MLIPNQTLSNHQGVVRLTCKHGNEEITVKFDCQNEEELEPDLEELENQVNGEEDTELDMGINFEVIIKKGDDKILIDCVACNELQIQNVRFFPSGTGIKQYHYTDMLTATCRQDDID